MLAARARVLRLLAGLLSLLTALLLATLAALLVLLSALVLVCHLEYSMVFLPTSRQRVHRAHRSYVV